MAFEVRHTLVALCSGVLLATASAAGSSQSVEELKQQVSALQAQLKQLQAQYSDCSERSRQCATDLQRAAERIRELEAARGEAGTPPATGSSEPGRTTGEPAPPANGGTPPGPPPATPAPPAPSAPANPFQDSAAVSEAIKARFAADFSGRPAPREGVQDDRLTRLWTNEVERWANQVNREFRRPVTWTVRVLHAESSGRSWGLEVVCVDPANQVDVGRPFWIQVQSVQAGSFEQAMKLGRGGADFLLRGVFIPQIAINPSRFDAGPFDQPPFIGTFLELGFRINVTSLVRVEDRPAPANRANKNPPTTPASPGAPGATPGAPSTAPPAAPPPAPSSSGPGAPSAPPPAGTPPGSAP